MSSDDIFVRSSVCQMQNISSLFPPPSLPPSLPPYDGPSYLQTVLLQVSSVCQMKKNILAPSLPPFLATSLPP